MQCPLQQKHQNSAPANGKGGAGGDDSGVPRGERREFAYREAASVIVNRETGVVTVRATGTQHARIQEFLDRVLASARRQVLIEATLVEVTLSDGYQQGIDWARIGGGSKWSMQSPTLGSNVGSSVTPFKIGYLSENL